MRYFLALSACCSALPLASAPAGIVLTQGTGANATTARDTFRTIVGGGAVGGANGSFGGLRREINWDGVPDSAAAPNSLPANFFNVNSPRGVVFSTPGTGFQVSANAGSGTPINFGNIDPSYTTTFLPFSPQRIFTAIGSNIVDVNFFVPGFNTPSTTSAFGAIFSDVDRTDTTSITLFDAANVSLGTFFVPALIGNGNLSFLGISGNAGEQIARVRIVSGNAALGAGVTDQQGDLRDLVVMDDFLYAEPLGVPEPGAWTLIISGLALVGWRVRKLRIALA